MNRRLDLHDIQAREAAARELLPPTIYNYFAAGAGEGLTVAANRAAFSRIMLRPRVLMGAEAPDLATATLGTSLAMPIALAPVAVQRLAHPEGEFASARAAGALGTAMIAPLLGTAAIESVTKAATGPVWFQLYMLRDRGVTRALVDRAVTAGATALVVTVDAAAAGQRSRGPLAGFSLPPGTTLPNLEGLGVSPSGTSRLSSSFAALVEPSVGWRDIDWLRSLSSLPLVLKGVLAAEDARHAVDHGVDAVVVSNHGGRLLDGAVAALDALPAIADAVGGQVELWMDGGVRSGTDVLKALALGARLVLIGRPIVWGLATGGEAGVTAVLNALRDELAIALAMVGCRTCAEATRALVFRPEA
jgi:4-hydroxymandelate oxidase